MSNAKLRVALVGAGAMGHHHARVIGQSDRAQLTAVIDPDRHAAGDIAQRHGCAWRADLGDLDDVDAAVVSAPTVLHSALAHRVLDAKVPLLLEKPLADELEQAQHIVDLAARRDVPLMCGFVERFNPAVLTAHAIVNEPVHISTVRHGPYSTRVCGGVAWDLLIHDVDACLRMVGAEPKKVTGSLGRFHPVSRPGAEDISDAVIEFAGSAVATVSASRISHRKVRTMCVTELDRVVEVDLLRRAVTIYRHVSHEAGDDGGLGYRQQTIMEIPELVAQGEPLVAQWEYFCDLVAGKRDAVSERDGILSPHRVVDQLCRRGR